MDDDKRYSVLIMATISDREMESGTTFSGTRSILSAVASPRNCSLAGSRHFCAFVGVLLCMFAFVLMYMSVAFVRVCLLA